MNDMCCVGLHTYLTSIDSLNLNDLDGASGMLLHNYHIIYFCKQSIWIYPQCRMHTHAHTGTKKTAKGGYSHSLYCCNWANSAGLRHTQLSSPMLPEARAGPLSLGGRQSTSGARGSDGYPWVKLCKKTEAKRFWDVISSSLQWAPCEHTSWESLKQLRPHENRCRPKTEEQCSNEQTSSIRLLQAYWLVASQAAVQKWMMKGEDVTVNIYCSSRR